MNIDLGSAVLDIGIGLAFVFFLFSVIASAVSEFIAGVLKLRANTLREGIEGMIGDEKIASDVLNHALVRTNGKKKLPGFKATRNDKASLNAKGRLKLVERPPSYVSATNFAHAFLEIMKTEPKPKQAEEAPKEKQFVWEQLEALGANSVLAKTKTEVGKIESWFNDSMDRVSGWYKRKSQYITIIVALVFVVGLNASTIRIVERLDKEPALRSAVAAAGEKVATKGCCGQETVKQEEEKGAEGKPTIAVTEIEKAGKDLSEASDRLGPLKLPFLWAGANTPSTVSGWATTALGWLLTVIAISLGAPFWFDTLGKLSNLRMAGKKPEECAKATG